MPRSILSPRTPDDVVGVLSSFSAGQAQVDLAGSVVTAYYDDVVAASLVAGATVFLRWHGQTLRITGCRGASGAALRSFARTMSSTTTAVDRVGLISGSNLVPGWGAILRQDDQRLVPVLWSGFASTVPSGGRVDVRCVDYELTSTGEPALRVTAQGGTTTATTALVTTENPILVDADVDHLAWCGWKVAEGAPGLARIAGGFIVAPPSPDTPDMPVVLEAFAQEPTGEPTPADGTEQELADRTVTFPAGYSLATPYLQLTVPAAASAQVLFDALTLQQLTF